MSELPSTTYICQLFSMSRSLLLLYKSILIPVFSEWLGNEDLCFLDCAVCNSQLRGSFLTVISQCTVYEQTLATLVNQSMIEWTIKRRLRITRLVFLKECVTDDDFIRNIFGLTEHLVELVLDDSFLPVLALLSTLTLNVDSLRIIGFNDEALEKCLPMMKSVHRLDISACVVTGRVYRHLYAWCPNLKFLSLPLDIAGYNEMNKATELNIACSMPTFTLTSSMKQNSLPLLHSYVCEALTVDVRSSRYAINLLAFCRNVISFEVHDQTSVNPLLLSLVSVCVQLKRIKLVKCDTVSYSAYEALTNKCSQLESLQVCQSVSLWSLLARCPKLTYLTAENNSCFEVFEEMATNLDALSMMPPTTEGRFVSLKLSKKRGDRKCLESISSSSYPPEDFKGLFAVNSTLRSIALVNQYSFNNEHLEMLVKLCPLLTSFSVANCSRITGAGLLHLSDCKHLVALQLTDMTVADDVVCKILSNKSAFERLVLRSYSGYTKSIMQTLACHSYRLLHIEVTNNAELLDNEVIELLIHCPQVYHIDFSGCRGLSDQLLPYVANRFLRHLNLQNSGVTKGAMEEDARLSKYVFVD